VRPAESRVLSLRRSPTNHFVHFFYPPFLHPSQSSLLSLVFLGRPLRRPFMCSSTSLWRPPRRRRRRQCPRPSMKLSPPICRPHPPLPLPRIRRRRPVRPLRFFFVVPYVLRSGGHPRVVLFGVSVRQRNTFAPKIHRFCLNFFGRFKTQKTLKMKRPNYDSSHVTRVTGGRGSTASTPRYVGDALSIRSRRLPSPSCRPPRYTVQPHRSEHRFFF